MKYTDDQIFGIFDHKASGIQTYLETSDSDLIANHEAHVKDLLLRCRVLGKKDNPNDVSNKEIAELKTKIEQIISDYGRLRAAGVYRMVGGKRENYSEAEAAPTVEKGSDFKEKSAPQYKTITIGDDKVDIDLENDLVYINDELVTADSDTPKHIIDVLRKAVPQVIKGETVKEPKEVKEEVITEGELLKFGSYKEFQKWLKDYNGKLSDKVKIMIKNAHGNPIIYDTPHKVLSAYEEGN